MIEYLFSIAVETPQSVPKKSIVDAVRPEYPQFSEKGETMKQYHSAHEWKEQRSCRIADVPAALRPCEKCEANGPASLSDAELLAVILRSGQKDKNALMLAEEILQLGGAEDGLLGLMRNDSADYLSVGGIGKVKAMQLLCIGELSRRIWKQHAAAKLAVRNPSSVADYYMEDLRHLDYECVFLMLLDQRDRLRKSLCISRGTMQGSMVSGREIFKEALRHKACGMILVHNHPSGDPAPSREDTALTKRISRGGVEMGVRLLDHIIIGDNCYFSFCEQGLLE